MPVAPAVLVDGLDGPSQACTSRLAPHLPVTPARSPPVEREAQKVEAGRTSAPDPRRSSEGHQARLVRVESQSVTPHPLRQHRHHALRIVLAFEADHEVVRIPYENRFPAQPRLDLALEPLVEHVVEIDVAE